MKESLSEGNGEKKWCGGKMSGGSERSRLIGMKDGYEWCRRMWEVVRWIAG